MPRRKRAVERKVIPDPVYQSVLVAKFTNRLMLNGKKSVAQTIVYHVMEELKKRLKKDPLELFTAAIETVQPQVEVKSRRLGGATYSIPVEVRPARRQTLAMRWVIEAARKRAPRAMRINLANELVDILEGKGGAMKKREEIHRMAEANKAFSHFRF